MMTFAIAILTVFLIIDCLFLGLLILVQLPKKDAGVGMAFGGGAADALFGAGSGTALTKLTRYSATAFFVLVFVLSYLNIHSNPSSAAELRMQIEKQSHETVPSAPALLTTPPASNAAISTNPGSSPSNLTLPATNLLLTPRAAAANAGTNPPPAFPVK